MLFSLPRTLSLGAAWLAPLLLVAQVSPSPRFPRQEPLSSNLPQYLASVRQTHSLDFVFVFFHIEILLPGQVCLRSVTYLTRKDSVGLSDSRDRRPPSPADISIRRQEQASLSGPRLSAPTTGHAGSVSEHTRLLKQNQF